MIKVLIVEDSRTVSQYLEYILGSDSDIEVVGNVANGKEAIDFVNNSKPDVITMDIDMPVMNGLESTRRIMSTIPVPIIVVTASRNARQMSLSIEALAAGALTIIPKPLGFGHPDEVEKTSKLLSLIKAYSNVKVIKRNFKPADVENAKSKSINFPAENKPSAKSFLNRKYVAIGISSGGPPVLAIIFAKLNKNFPYPILIVQHITPGFLEGMVTWLGRLSNLPIHIATANEKVLPGHIYFAPDNFQMSVKHGKINLQKRKSEDNICPSVAHLFNSFAIYDAKETIALLLTGMGRDGADEMKLLHDAGSVTIAQDKESSLVHGMPGEAIKLGAANYILNPDQIVSLMLEIDEFSTKK